MPMLITLEGDANDGYGAVYNPEDAYYKQKFSTLGGWGAFNFLRPSRLKKTTAVVGTVTSAVAPLTGPFAPVVAAAGAGTLAASGALAAAHASYRKKGADEGTGYKPGQYANAEADVPAKKPVPWIPIAIAGGGLLAAFGLAG